MKKECIVCPHLSLHSHDYYYEWGEEPKGYDDHGSSESPNLLSPASQARRAEMWGKGDVDIIWKAEGLQFDATNPFGVLN